VTQKSLVFSYKSHFLGRQPCEWPNAV